MDRGAQQDIVHGVAECQTPLSIQAHSMAAFQCCVSNGFCCKAVNQLCVSVYSLLSGFLSHLGHHGAQSRAPTLYSRFSFVMYFIPSVHICQSQSATSFHPCFPVFYLCVSISAFQIGSSAPLKCMKRVWRTAFIPQQTFTECPL